MHLCMKIPRVTSKNPVTEGDSHGFLFVSVKVLNGYEICYIWFCRMDGNG